MYGPDYQGQIDIARKIKADLREDRGVVDVDWYVEADQPRYRFEVDKEKAALNGVSTEQVDAALRMAVAGDERGAPAPALGEGGRSDRAAPSQGGAVGARQPEAVRVMGRAGNLVPLGEVVRVKEEIAEKSIYHKNLMPVVYVTADVAGKEESPVYAILSIDKIARQAADSRAGTSSSGTSQASRPPTGSSP